MCSNSVFYVYELLYNISLGLGLGFVPSEMMG